MLIDFEVFLRLHQVAKSGSLSKAAEALYISRPALVHQVKAAEAKLGFTIFYRTAKGISLTPIGKVFLEEGFSIFNDFEQLCNKCLMMNNPKPKAVVIGILPKVYSTLISFVCKKYKALHPNINIELKQIHLQDYTKKFLIGELDVAPDYMFNLAQNLCDSPSIGIIPCKPLQLGLCILKTDPLVRLETIELENLRGRKLMLHSRGVSKCDDLFRDYLETHEPSINIIDIPFFNEEAFIKAEFENALLVTIKEFTFSPPSFLFKPMDKYIPVERGLIYRKDCRPEVKDFIGLLTQEIEKNDL